MQDINYKYIEFKGTEKKKTKTNFHPTQDTRIQIFLKMQATSNQRGGEKPEAQIQGTRRGEGGDQVGIVQNRIPDLSFLCSAGQTSETSTRLMLP